jgi:alpha,alpha-trehalose-phosphate synthase [UDP-forming]
MTSLRLQLRFLLPLVLALLVAAYLALPLMDRLTLRWFSRDLTLRGELVTNTLADTVAESLRDGSSDRLLAVFARVAANERLVAVALCSRDDRLLRATPLYPARMDCAGARTIAARTSPVITVVGGPVHVGVYDVPAESVVPILAPGTDGAPADGSAGAASAPAEPAVADAGPAARVVLLQDFSYIARRSEDTRRYLVWFIAALGAAMVVITVVVAQISWRGWISGTRALLRGEGLVRPLGRRGAGGSSAGAGDGELGPLADELRQRLRDLEDDYRRSLGPEAPWNAERLRGLLDTHLRGDEVIVVSNREPYIHDRDAQGRTVVRRPASGLVTAIEPVVKACGGTWIAHGGGSADRDTVDADDRLRVPPGEDAYTLRRLWLTEAEEQGYYYGFANEGLWPLCHVAHVRPVFREADWHAYREVNQRFADAVVEEARSDDPIVLVQDYHFALVPAMVREKLPAATILTFWHIPWPNPESFGICPWRRELLEGLLGSTIVGFHTRFHGKNFLETVDRYLEARIEHEHSTVSFRDDETFVESYPISIAWPTPQAEAARAPVEVCRQRVFERLGLPAAHRLAIGVDRFDYTKGILERLHAVERLLEKHTEWIGRFSFVQVAAPTRSSLEEYRAFQERITGLVKRIDERFGTADYHPVILLATHHDHAALEELYRAADLCLVTSLHDGMNLVSKEFVAARDDERGVLVLSRFAGAARELTEALVVNPYHVEECADAIQHALTMPEPEQRERMASLRVQVRESNVFRWAGRMLMDAARLRQRQRVQARVRQHRRRGITAAAAVARLRAVKR